MINKWGFREVWLLSLAVKVALALLLPLSLDEYYYWVWGQNPQLSYYDHPPMVGWLFIGGSRLPGVLLGHCTLLIWNSLLKNFFSDSQRKLWLIFVLASPLVGWGSLIQTPDVSLLFFWSASLIAFLRALETKKQLWYITLGAVLGLGFCSKYLIVLFVPVIFLYLFFEKAWKEVRWQYVPLTVGVGLLFCAPVLIWNYQNDWASFSFQLGHGLKSGPRKNSLWPLKYLVEQILILFPTVVAFAFRSRLPGRLRILLYASAFPLAFFFFTSFKARVEPNWPIIAYPSALTIAFLTMQNSVWLKRTIYIWAVCFAVVLAEVFFQIIPLPPEKLKTRETMKFDAFLEHAKELQPIYGSSYQLASAMSYKLKRVIPKLQGMNRRDFYDFFPPARPNSDRFFVMIEGDEPLPDWVHEEGYELGVTTPVADNLRIVEVVKRAKASDT